MIPFGVTFYPDQWPEESWESHFKQIKAAGFNIVRFGEMAWDWVEPEAGKFNFAPLDRALGACEKQGLKVLLGIPTSQVPPWFHRKFPNSRPVAQDGTLYPEFGPRPNICKDHHEYRKLALRLASHLVQRYRKRPALAMWQVDNEPVYPPLDHTTSNDFCHCEHSRAAFIAWARKKYGSLKNLNAVWGTRFWTNTFSSFDDIQTPKAGIWEAVSPHIFLDWFRFKSERIRDWVSDLAKMVRNIDPIHKVGTNGFIGICTRTPDHNLIPVDLDWYGLDIYPKGGKMSKEDYAFHLDLWRSFTRGTKAQFHLTELQGGQNVRWGSPAFVEGPEIREWTQTALKHGAQAILYHAWRPPLFGAETGGFGILKSDGSATKRLGVIKDLSRKLQNTNNKLQTIPKSKIAIVYLHSAEVQTYQEQGPPRGIVGQWEAVRADLGIMYCLLSLQGAHLVAARNGTPVDFIFEKDMEAGNLPYKTIFMPNPYLLSKHQYQNLRNWVHMGGKLITEARFGLKDEDGHLYPNPLMEDLLGVVYDHGEITEGGFLDVFEGQPKKEKLFKKKIGKGKLIYANFSLFLQIKKGNKSWFDFDR